MLNYAAHIGFLWHELDFYQRIAAAREAGFQAIELTSPEKYDEQRLSVEMRASRMALSCFVAPLGNVAGGEVGFMCVPGKEARFEETVRESIERAGRLNCRRFMAATGVVTAGMTRAQAEQKALDNLRAVLPLLEQADLRLMIEPIDRSIVANFLVNSTADGAAMVEAVGSPRVQLEYDLYHAGLMGDDLVDTWGRYGHLVGHIQIADVPGRHEPGTGKLPVRDFLAAVERSGYRDYVSLEYHPAGATGDSLAWIAPQLRG